MASIYTLGNKTNVFPGEMSRNQAVNDLVNNKESPNDRKEKTVYLHRV